LKEAKQHYDFIFVDSPPLLPVADATEIAPLMDGVFMVYTVGKIGRGVLKRAKSNLDNVDAKVIGVILNNIKPEAGPEYFRYHSHYYYGPEGKTEHKKQSMKDRILNFPGMLFKKKLLRFALLIFVLSLITLGIFWQDINMNLPVQDWISSYKNIIVSYL